MSQTRDSFLDLEKHLNQLEEQVNKLIITLDEWRQWKDEYETLRVDVKALPSTATREDLAAAQADFDGELVNEKELLDIFGRANSKKREQVLSTLTNRLDYVSKNIDTLAKQLDAAENKLAATRVVSNPDATDEDGLPITEIMEELDDDDNVLSYKLRRPGDNEAQLVEALEKAGVNDIPSGGLASSTQPTKGTSENVLSTKPAAKSIAAKDHAQPGSEQKPAEKTPNAPAKAPAKKKSVKFSEDTKASEPDQPTDTARRIEEIMREAKEQQGMISDPVYPADDTPEDAALREDMLSYNKDTEAYELAPVVAEMQLEHVPDDEDEDWGSDDYDDDDDDDNDNEDRWGKSSAPVDDDWKRQMLELKERLSKHSWDVKKTVDEIEEEEGQNDDANDLAEGIGRISIRPAQSKPEETEDIAAKPKKSVQFTPSLDIAEPSTPAITKEPHESVEPEENPISDVVERKPGATSTPSALGKKPSRFRANRANGTIPAVQKSPVVPQWSASEAREVPSGPADKTISTVVQERETSAAAKEPDEFDTDLLHRQATEELYKVRNRMIQKQGGFMKEDENPIQPIDEEEGGRKVSRFKAARLARS
ncbi:hypothetical protein F5Y15DRAFT_296158 [Xylariaceae sp. FL0016]|nr:hypothetical protein F5Y15DRAFT_296158 [Xylariaceae sp. FL0016]